MKAEDYDVVKVIGRGAFGEVQLVSFCFTLFLFGFWAVPGSSKGLLLALHVNTPGNAQGIVWNTMD